MALTKAQALAKIKELQEYVENLEGSTIRQWLIDMHIPESGIEVLGETQARVKAGWCVYSWTKIPSPFVRFQVCGDGEGGLRVALFRT